MTARLPAQHKETWGELGPAYLLVCSVALAPDLECKRENALAIIPLHQTFVTEDACQREAGALVNLPEAVTAIDHGVKLACDPR